jgi:hypothetical protein
MRNSRTLINTRARAKGRNQHYVLSEIERLNKKQRDKSLTVWDIDHKPWCKEFCTAENGVSRRIPWKM